MKEQTKTTRTTAWEFGLLVILVLTLGYYALTQSLVSSQGGHPYDADAYYGMAEQVAAGEAMTALRPFGYRIALPFLTGKLFPAQLNHGFLILNLAFGLLTLLLLYGYLRLFLLRRDLALLLLLLFVTSPMGVFRFAHFIPAYTDPPALFFVLLFLYLARTIQTMTWQWSLLLAALAALGCSFREIAICGLLVLVFYRSFSLSGRAPFLHLHSRREFLLLLPPLFVALLTLALIHARVEAGGGYSYAGQFGDVVLHLLDQASLFPLAWLVAFGAIPLVLLTSLNRGTLLFLGRNQDVLVFLLGSLLLGLLVGFHTDRIVYWAYPAMLLLFGQLVEGHPLFGRNAAYRLAFWGPFLAVQILAYRAWLPIPDDPDLSLASPGSPAFHLFAPYGEAVLGQTFSSTMTADSRTILLLQFSLVAVYFLGLFAVERKTRHAALSRERP